MTELKRLEMLVRHYEEKEKKLIEFIEKEIEVSDENKSQSDNYNNKMEWIFYQKALIKVLKEIYRLDRN